MIFENTVKPQESKIKLGQDTLEIVQEYKYLGHIIRRQLCDVSDIKHRLNSFYSKCNAVFRNFRNVSIETFMFLFNSYCKPDYGLALWNIPSVLNRHIFKTFEIAFNNAIKKILGAPLYSSSHISAEICNVLLLSHHLSLVQAKFLKRIWPLRLLA